MVVSARAVGAFKDFHLWTDRRIEGATCHKIGRLELDRYLFKLLYLRDAASHLNYDYLVWLDADTFFVRDPGDLLRVLQGSPIHVSLEEDLALPEHAEARWWGCPNPELVRLMRSRGVRDRSVFSTNAGFFIVHHDVIDTVFNLAFEFWHASEKAGYRFTEEPLLSYCMQMLCGDPRRHTLAQTSDLWCSDWKGVFASQLPDGQLWQFMEQFSKRLLEVNPAIVHAIRSKPLLVAQSAKEERPPRAGMP